MPITDPPIVLLPLDEKRATANWRELLQQLQNADCHVPGHGQTGPLADTLSAIFDLSAYLRTLALGEPKFLQLMLSEGLDAASDELWQFTAKADIEAKDEADLKKRLRQLKRKCALLCGVADLGGWWQLEKVCATLSRFADLAVGATCRFILRQAHDQGKLKLPDRDQPERGSGLIILAMGKHGAGELNYSSDIDLICLFDSEATGVPDPDAAQTLFPRLVKQLVAIMQDRTGDGYVFRTDLRLRPDPGSTPIAVSVLLALNYYESSGQNWERAAHIKARQVAGDLKAGAQYLKELQPYIWRKYLDYAAIADIHAIKRQIHSHRGHGTIAVVGHNLKLGRGGIREIEFFVQTQQLIAGGRVDELRGRGTLIMLKVLCDKQWISGAARDEMSAAYVFLRNIEHRLQMVADEQTHTMPSGERDLRRIARMAGFDEFSEFSPVLEKHLRLVEGHYGGLFEQEDALSGKIGNLVFTGDDNDPGTLATLSELGFERPETIIKLVRDWHYGRYRVMQSRQARERLTELTPALLLAFAQTNSADAAALAFDRFLQGLPVGVQLFALLKSNPELLRLLAEILGIAPRLADIITRKPHVFDSLLDPEFFQSMPTKDKLGEMLGETLGRSASYEDALDRARIFALEQKFLIGVRYLGNTIDAPRAGEAFSELADVLIGAMLTLVRAEFEQKHGIVDGAAMAVIGMGRLGSRELTTGSDIDLILLYDHNPAAELSNGQKPLPVSQYFVRLTQRFITAMSAPTAEGTIYELDFRLRPSGRAGPLATHIDSFCTYQQKQAWTWEHMALTRARLITGGGPLVRRANKEIAKIITMPRDGQKLVRDVHEMRQRLEKEKPARSVWDIKNTVGGLIDIDFILQWAELAGNIGRQNSKATTSLEKLTIFAESDRKNQLLQNDKMTLASALHIYGAIDQLLRLCLNGDFNSSDAPAGLMDRLLFMTGFPDQVRLESHLSDTGSAVRDVYNRLIKIDADKLDG